MVKIGFIIMSIVAALFLYFLNIWFEEENLQIERLNKKYIKNTRKLKNISQINSWLNTKVKKNLKELPKDSKSADLKLIDFFDSHAKEYTLKVKKFIYKDDFAHLLTISYTLSRENYKTLNKFIKQEYKSGYILLQNFKIAKSTVSGDLILVQPYPSKKVKKSEVIDVVPQ
jgi:hypothetical protein